MLTQIVTFSADDGASIDVKFDSQGANTTGCRLSYDADGSQETAVAREVLFRGSDLGSAIAASTSGDSYVLTINDGTSASTYTYTVTGTSGTATVTNWLDICRM